MIRELTTQDLSQVCQMEQAIFSDAWTEKNFIESMENQDCKILVSVSESGVIEGYSCLYHALDEGEIVNVAVNPNYRQKGIGYQLVGALIDYGNSKGICSYYLEVRESNLPAQRLYKKLGFEAVGVRKNFYHQPTEHALIMCRQMQDNQ